MLKILYAGCFGLPPAIRCSSHWKCVAAKNRKKKFTKTAYFGAIDRSRFLTLMSIKRMYGTFC